MSDNSNYGFGRFVPGFDFLQNLAKGASLPQLPNLSNWIAPTLNVEELDKRIGELKAVQFWLEQNGKALAATVQALEVQKMTLATLKGMNFNMGELAEALKVKTADGMAAGMRQASESVQAASKAASQRAAPKASPAGGVKPKAGNGEAAPAVDPLQWWGALTQQFQQIASNAMQDVAQTTAANAARKKATGAKDEAPAAKPARKAPARKSAARKARGKS